MQDELLLPSAVDKIDETLNITANPIPSNRPIHAYISEMQPPQPKHNIYDIIVNNYINIPNKFNKITLTIEDNIIIIEPIDVYDSVNLDIKNIDYIRVVIYKFTYLAKGKEPLITTVPYYLSDGYTNKFRGNVLLPFMCFSNLANDPNCPKTRNDYQKKGVLIKYKFWNYMDTDKLHKYIINILKKKDPNLYKLKSVVNSIINGNYINSKREIISIKNTLFDVTYNQSSSAKICDQEPFNKVECQKIIDAIDMKVHDIIDKKNIDIENILYLLSNNNNIDINSFIYRLDNPINYLLFLANLSEDIPINCYFPTGIRFGNENDYNKYNMEYSKETFNYTDYFRYIYIESMIEKTIQHKKFILENKIVQIEQVEFNKSSIKIKNHLEFNEIMKRCDNDMKNTVMIVGFFSALFQKILVNKYTEIPTPINKELINLIVQPERKNPLYKSYINDYNNSFNLLFWKTKCPDKKHKKYLKYKLKYLALKKLFN